ncbi:PRC-barrel domain-containing protein [Fredinandcohnia humi]
MKKSTEIVGLPIISIQDGQEVGKVKSLVINPDKGSVDFLTIEHEDWQVSVKAIPFKKVVGIGEYAVTVESESAVIDLNEIPIANQLVNKKIKITNNKVMTRKGQLIGEVVEYYVDDENGNILGMQLTVANREVALASASVLTYGKDIIIVNEDATSHFLDSVEQLVNPEVEVIKNQEVNEKDSLKNDTIDPFEGLNLVSEDEEVVALKEKQVELLKGKTVSRDILDNNGNVLFPEGTILSAEDVMKAQEEGPNIVIDLSMNVLA